jgi:hypothetical protein
VVKQFLTTHSFQSLEDRRTGEKIVKFRVWRSRFRAVSRSKYFPDQASSIQHPKISRNKAQKTQNQPAEIIESSSYRMEGPLS